MAPTPESRRLAIFRARSLCVDRPSDLIVRASRQPAPARLRLDYFSVVPISLNTVLTLVPTAWTATMMNTAIRLAISAYSIAVTPDSSLRKFRTRSIWDSPDALWALRSQVAAVPKPRLSKWPQDPDHEAKSHPPIANGSTGLLKFYRLRAKGRDCSLILNQMALGAQ